MLMVGPPGSGKSMPAWRLPSPGERSPLDELSPATSMAFPNRRHCLDNNLFL
jgi:hypothetical protein